MTPAQLAQQVRLLEISTRRSVTEVFAGEYSSAFKGRGMEFADVREYQPGDEIRTIDWNVTARAGRPFVKRFTEERELTVVLAVDLSASGRFGTGPGGRSKQQTATEIAALLAFAAARKHDRVGLLIFTDRVEHYIPPKKGSRHTLRLIRELLAFEPTHAGTDLAAAADHLAKVLHRSSVVFLISDFLAADIEPTLRHVSRRHDLIALDIMDPREFELPAAGMIEVRDPETGERIVLDTSSRRVRESYRVAAQKLEEARHRSLRRIGADRVRLSTASPYVHDLALFFREREHRR